MNIITAELDYVAGHLRYGHIELELDDKQFEEFKSLSEKEQKEWLKDEGELIIDDFEVNERGDIVNIEW